MIESHQNLRTRLRALTSFIPIFESRGFSFGEWSGSSWTYSGPAHAFIHAAYDNEWVVAKNFNWIEWSSTEEAQQLHDNPAALEKAGPTQLAHLLTMLLRSDRFCDGALCDAFGSGLLPRILRRAAAIESAIPINMKLHSPYYLNPFQSFTERAADDDLADLLKPAIENNLSRSVFSALAHSDRLALARFLEALAPKHTARICATIEKCSAIIRSADPSLIEFGLQSWPEQADQLHKSAPIPHVLMIGISSSHSRQWTHDKRSAPERPIPDAWIYLAGKMLLVFECKNDEHPLDATQISDYAHRIGLLRPEDNFPRAAAKASLSSPAEAERVQKACVDCVLDASWSIVATALRQINLDESIDSQGRWLCGQAAQYIHWHVYPPYRGLTTILEWLNGPNTSDRRAHLRRLVARMGDALNSSADAENGITFAKNEENEWDLQPGAGSAVYTKLCQGGELILKAWLGRKLSPVLWFRFSETGEQTVGLELYLQAQGSAASKWNDAQAWNQARRRHLNRAETWQKMLEKWVDQAAPDVSIILTAARFRGKSRSWLGGGVDAHEWNATPLPPREALELLERNREKLWCFPAIEDGADEATFTETAACVRKPAFSLLIPLDLTCAVADPNEGSVLQNLLQKAIVRLGPPEGLYVQ